MEKYKVCGTDRQGKRFTMNTNCPQNYNFWRANIWENLPNGHKKLVGSVWN